MRTDRSSYFASSEYQDGALRKVLGSSARAAEGTHGADGWLASALAYLPQASRLKPLAFSFTDQALAVGGGFLANVALARTGTKEEYGMFALSYSVFTFLAALHNSMILEPYTVYGSGRYRERSSDYLRLMVRTHLRLSLLLSALILLLCSIFWRVAPHLVSPSLWGLGLTVGVLLTGVLLRRAFYVQREPSLAARSSLVFFLMVVIGLEFALKLHYLNGLSVFLILALGWIAASASFGTRLPIGEAHSAFLQSEPGYWGLHWRYARWVLATAFVFQLMTQGYYWLLAGFLSVREVGELRAMYNVIAPVDQIFIAMGYLVIPAMAAHYATKRPDRLLSLWRRYAVGVLGVTASFALGVRVLGRPLMHLLYAGGFDDLSPLLYVLAFCPLIMGIGNTMNDALKAMERPKFVFLAYVCSGITTFLAGVPLVRHFGLPGAVYGMLVSAAAYSAFLVFSFFLLVPQRAKRVGLPQPT
jgi:O-antigen/teichoic acid export membrane protein